MEKKMKRNKLFLSVVAFITLAIMLLTFFMSINVFNASESNNVNVVNNSDKLLDEVSKYKDTDHDGIIDLLDKDPYKWNVSNRDLRFFEELSYISEENLLKIQNGDEETIEWFNKEKLNGTCDVREISKYWKLVRKVSGAHGFSATIFGNGSVGVLVVEGSDRHSKDDILDDIYLTLGLKPYQADEVVKLKEDMQQFSEYYVAGHSLGGYLAAYYAGAVGKYDSKFVRAVVFNSPGVVLTFHRWIQNNVKELTNETFIDDSDISNVITEKKLQAIRINGDIVSGLYKLKNSIQLNSELKNKHTSRSFVNRVVNDEMNKYFSVGYRADNLYKSYQAQKVLDAVKNLAK